MPFFAYTRCSPASTKNLRNAVSLFIYVFYIYRLRSSLFLRHLFHSLYICCCFMEAGEPGERGREKRSGASTFFFASYRLHFCMYSTCCGSCGAGFVEDESLAVIGRCVYITDAAATGEKEMHPPPSPFLLWRVLSLSLSLVVSEFLSFLCAPFHAYCSGVRTVLEETHERARQAEKRHRHRCWCMPGFRLPLSFYK